MLPYQSRSKTADGKRIITFKNLGEEYVEEKHRLGERNVYSRENIQIINKISAYNVMHMFSNNNVCIFVRVLL